MKNIVKIIFIFVFCLYNTISSAEDVSQEKILHISAEDLEKSRLAEEIKHKKENLEIITKVKEMITQNFDVFINLNARTFYSLLPFDKEKLTMEKAAFAAGAFDELSAVKLFEAAGEPGHLVIKNHILRYWKG